MYKFTNAEKEIELHVDGEISMNQSLWDWFFNKPDKSATGLRATLEKNDSKPVTVWINSLGGDVFAASVLYTALRKHKGRVTVKVDGTAISAASVIAMGGDEIQMSPTSIMMIHNPATYAEGDYREMAKAGEVLAEVKETIINAYETKTGLSRDKISEMMNEETWMSAQKAVELGFADKIIGEEAPEGEIKNDFALMRRVYNAYKGAENHVEIPVPEDESDDARKTLAPEDAEKILNSLLK